MLPVCARLVLLHPDGSKPKSTHGPTRHPDSSCHSPWVRLCQHLTHPSGSLLLMAFYSKHLDDQVQQSVFLPHSHGWHGSGKVGASAPSFKPCPLETNTTVISSKALYRPPTIHNISFTTTSLPTQHHPPLTTIPSPFIIRLLPLSSLQSFLYSTESTPQTYPICGHRLSRGNFRSISISGPYCFPCHPAVSGHFWTHVLNSLCLSLVSVDSLLS